VPTKKRALITGASSGIGRCYAIHLAKHGYDIVAVARRGDLLATLADEVRQFGAQTTAIEADLADNVGVAKVISIAHDIDHLVLNAGVTHAARVGASSGDEITRLNTLLATGVVQVCEAVVPRMLANKRGNVVIVSSIAAFTPMPKSAVYAAAKTYVMSYGRSLNLELAGSGVRVCVVCPGYVRTELHTNAGLEHLRQRVPKFLWIEPIEVVKTAERGLAGNKSVVVPGLVYRISRPLLGSGLAQKIWRRTTRRK